jgi:hypothetical protein
MERVRVREREREREREKEKEEEEEKEEEREKEEKEKESGGRNGRQDAAGDGPRARPGWGRGWLWSRASETGKDDGVKMEDGGERGREAAGGRPS